MPIITLTTDFGMRDPDLGALKGHILKAIPGAQLIDISHQAMPFDVEEAVYIVQNALKNFPAGSMHLIGFESESDAAQPPLMSLINGQYYLSNHPQIVSTAFAGIDARHFSLEFAENGRFLQAQIRAAKLLAQGQQPEQFARKTEDPGAIKLQQPIVQNDPDTGKVKLIIAKVIYNDHYGNAIFNLTKDDFEKWQEKRAFKIKFGRNEIDRLVATYKIRPEGKKTLTMDGKMFAHFNDFGYLEIFLYKSNTLTGGANTLLGLQKNSTVHIVFENK